MFVKICGTTSAEDARLSVEAGADALGFIFAPSKRRVTVQQVAAITRELPPGVERVGVFTEPDAEAIGEAVRAAGLTAVQMHWSYSRDVVAELRSELGIAVQLWQVVGFQTEPEDTQAAELAFVQQLRASLLDPAVDLVLLDSIRGSQSGGLGEAFAWERAAGLVQQELLAAERRMAGTAQTAPRIMLAGGLTAENVRDAIAALGPMGVDVVSGVEERRGKKDPERVRAFVRAAREAFGDPPRREPRP